MGGLGGEAAVVAATFSERRVEGSGYYIRGTRDTIPVRLVHPNPWNPNRMTEREFEALKGAIRKNGFLQEVLVRPHPVIEGEYQAVDGEHRSTAVQALAQLDPDSPVDVRIIEADDWEAKRLTIQMNLDRGSHDRVAEAGVLAELVEHYGEEDVLEALPHERQELRDVVALAGHDWGQYGDGGDDEDDDEKGSTEWVRVEVVMTTEDHASYLEARAKVADVVELSGNEAVEEGQVVAALAAEYLSSNGLED